MEINKLTHSTIPERLRQIPVPPKQLFTIGVPLDELLERPVVTVVGSRKVSAYGREVTHRLSGELAANGITIVSGLALGVDAIAHQAALDAGGITIAVLPGPIEKIYPSSHRQLAERIIRNGGALISEYPAGTEPFRVNFIARNRLVSGLGDVLLITEAAEKSGSLHTARFALEQGKDVLAVPGNITSPTSAGTNNLIKSGAGAVTETSDVHHVLGLQPLEGQPLRPKGANENEQLVLNLLAEGITEGEQLVRASNLDIALFNQTLTMLEITGKIRSLGSDHWTLA